MKHFNVILSSMFQFSWEMPFFESGGTEVFKAGRNKLFFK